MPVIIKHRVTGDVLRMVDADNLTGADLRWADLTGADLTGADLTGADLRWAYLGGADLTEANLTEADLRGADLSRANLTEADLSRADLGGQEIIDAGQDSQGYRFVAVPHDDGVRIAVGCHWFTAEEALLHWALKYEAMGKVRTLLAEARRRKWAIQPGVALDEGFDKGGATRPK